LTASVKIQQTEYWRPYDDQRRHTIQPNNLRHNPNTLDNTNLPNTEVTMKVQITYPKKKCPICGKTFTKHHNRQVYCSPECSKEAKKLQDRKARLRWVNKNKKRLYQTQIGTRTIGPRPNPDTDREAEIVQNEKERLGLTMF